MVPIRDIKIIFHDEKPHYSPGSTVKGEVRITAEEPEECKSIVVGIFGRAHVLWNVDNRTYTNSITYIKEESVVWSQENSSPSGYLPAGEHSFPFEYHLPDDIPPSFSFDSYVGKIQYEVHTEFSRSGIFKGSFKFNSVFTVKANTSSALLASCMEPNSVDLTSYVKFLCFDFGSIRLSCDLPRTGFSPGDVIPINVHIENQTTKSLRIHASLYRINIYISSEGRKYITPKHRESIVISPQIQAGVITSFKDTTKLKISSEAPPTFRSCPCISVEYILAIKAVTHSSLSGSSRDMNIPIVIAEAEPTTRN